MMDDVARDARACRWLSLVFAALTLISGAAFVASGFGILLLFVTAAFLVGTFFLLMIGFMA